MPRGRPKKDAPTSEPAEKLDSQPKRRGRPPRKPTDQEAQSTEQTSLLPADAEPVSHSARAMMKRREKPKLRILALGGVEEIGKNMTVIECGDDIIVVDCGLMFPDEDMLGVDYVIPDPNYLLENYHKVRAIVYTHGHEDHIGATPFVLPMLNVPLYGTRLTMALIGNKFKEHGINNAQVNVVKPGDVIRLGKMSVEFIKVSHSIAGACALAITTPLGVLFHTGDFKIDYTPVDDEPMDINRIATLGREGVLALLSESTNVEREGYTMSERTVGETLNKYFAQAHGRVIVATFASNVHRVQQIIDAAARQGRKVSFSGRSMVNVATLAIELGEMFIPEGMLVQPDQLSMFEDHEIAIITTGSQGETMSGLARMARGEHRFVNIKSGDTVILSAHPVPGNEKFVSRLINQLYLGGAEVVYEALADVHVSGHARQEELKLIYQLIQPKYFIPIHGEYRHLMQHAAMVERMGHDRENIFIPRIGVPIALNEENGCTETPVQAGALMVDGTGIGDVGNAVLRDRRQLSEDGLVVAAVTIDALTGEILLGPTVISRGYIFVRENPEMIEELRLTTRRVVNDAMSRGERDISLLRNSVREKLRTLIYEQTKRNPVILPMIEVLRR